MDSDVTPKGSGNLASIDARDVAYANYILNLLAPFNGLTGIVAIVLAYLKRNDANDLLDSHYTYQIRTFWIGLLGFITSILLMFVLVGFVTLPLLAIWWFLRNGVGLKRLLDNQELVDPDTWLI